MCSPYTKSEREDIRDIKERNEHPIKDKQCTKNCSSYFSRAVHGACHVQKIPPIRSVKKDKLQLSTNRILALRYSEHQLIDCNSTLYSPSRNVCNDNSKLNVKYGALGFSVHIAENDEIITGAPGVFRWSGSVVRTKMDQMDKPDIPDPGLWDSNDSALFGYAVSSGYFEIAENQTKMLYVASAPRNNSLNGTVHIFDIVDFRGNPNNKTIDIYHTFYGEQMSEYFGYSLVVDDFDGDGRKDIAIGAPYHHATG